MTPHSKQPTKAQMTEQIIADMHRGQLHVIGRRKRFNHVRCHRRFGKSVLSYNLLAEAGCSGKPAAFIMPTAVEYEKRWRECVQGLAPIISKVHVQDGVIELFNKARIEFFGLHRYDGIRGNHYARVIIDEAAHSPYLEEAWLYAISPTLADLEGDAWFFSTPKGNNYFKQLEDDNKNDADWSFMHIPVTSEHRNPYLKDREIERQRKNLPTSAWRQEWLAEYVDVEGARVRREWLRYSDKPSCTRYAIGVDLAVSLKQEADYTAIVVVGEDSSGNVHIVDVYRERLTFNDILSTIKSYADKWQAQSIAIEKVQAQAYVAQELIRTTMLPIDPITPQGDKLARFMPIEGKLEHGYLHLSRGLAPYFEDELLNFPSGQHDDMVDALVYAVHALEYSNKLQIIAL
ncbi:Archaeophage PsiM2, terminase large subunit [uncultured Caudovirales phage]|uniref:Archaeophage PsiM2, terminase large subunit n=1 Tax=uncultured Caudovirales phage TaxID=2100421 RepID=A0A6J5M3D4_9CAUD|nr:Archaeophage PsiM2, terminase large subunit [uncultured Caudovirales phage]